MRMNRHEFLSRSAAVAGSAFILPFIPEREASSATERFRMEFQVKRLTLKHTWTISRNSSAFKDNVFVTLSAAGVTGYGEAAPNVRYSESAESTLEFLAKAKPLVEASDPWMFHDLGLKIHSLGEGQTAAKCGVDIAMMDWLGKKLGVPLYRLWGLDPTRIPLTTFSIGIDTPEVMQQKVREAAAFPVLKIKVGTADDRRNVEAIRRVTDKPLRVDANEGWKTKEQALENIRWLATQGVEFIEQPLPSSMLEETGWLKERVEMPIIADESVKRAGDIPRLAQAFDGINIKLMKSGGLQEALRMIAMARSLNLKIMLGCMIESSVAIAAGAHIAPLTDWIDLDGNLLISDDPYKGLAIRNGQWTLSSSPGLGVQPA